MAEIVGVIPSRYESSRFPGKPLARIGDKTMVRMVYERCRESKLLNRVLVATDDERIRAEVESFAIMTSPDIATGTDRCHAAAGDMPCDIVVNIQGDEPLIDPTVIDACAGALLEASDAVCATPIALTRDAEEIASANSAKVAVNKNMEALYFSRSPIPFNRAGGDLPYYKHIGLYAYRRDFLREYVKLSQTPMELAESLEQLRMLENGFRIQCCLVEYQAIGVDTPEDLEKVRGMIGA